MDDPRDNSRRVVELKPRRNAKAGNAGRGAAAANGREQTEAKKTGRPRKGGPAIEIVRGLQLWHAPDQRAFATVDIAGVDHHLPVRDEMFASFLRREHYRATGEAIGAAGEADAVGIAESIGRFDGPCLEVYTRVARIGDRVFVHMANAGGQVIEIAGDGWGVTKDCPARFVRSSITAALPLPEDDGSVDDLRQFVNVKTDDDFTMLVAWAVAAWRGMAPYPILLLGGSQGTGKSTVARLVRGVVDPSTVLLSNPPKEERDAVVLARYSHCLSYDNVSTVHPWLADLLCTMATGGGYIARKLNTDAGLFAFRTANALILNSIVSLGSRPDFGDRSFQVHLARIAESERRLESEYWAAVDAAAPSIVGGLATAVSSALRREHLPRHHSLPRLADPAQWVIAAEEGLGWTEGTFLRAFAVNRDELVTAALDGTPVGDAMRRLVDRMKPDGEIGEVWRGTATDLLDALAVGTGSDVLGSRSWPETPQRLADILARLADALRACGISMDRVRDSGRSRARLVVISRVKA